MLKTRVNAEEQPSEIILPPDIQKIVNERGFYLYEWISIDELRLTIECDYLNIIQKSSGFLFVIMVIIGIIWFITGSISGLLYALIGLLGLFYVSVFLIILFNFLRRSYLYIRGSNVVITDEHFIFGRDIFFRTDTYKIHEIFSKYEKAFEEKFLEKSGLVEWRREKQEKLFETFREIFMKWKTIITSMGDFRNALMFVPVLILIGGLYGVLMISMYLIGLPIIYIFGKVCFSGIAYVLLRMRYRTEYAIQSCFMIIYSASVSIAEKKNTLLLLLKEARNNEWKENLLGKIQDIFPHLSWELEQAVNTTKKLSHLIEQSRYQWIFNFEKYRIWTHAQILEPINSILLLLDENLLLLNQSIETMNEQIKTSTDIFHQKILEVQKLRLQMQVKSFNQNRELLSEYKSQL